MDKKGRFTPTMKLSKGKITLPARKQVFRVENNSGNFIRDTIALHNEEVEGRPLLTRMMDNGEIVTSLPTLETIRKRGSEQLSALPDRFKRLRNAPPYPVELSPKLKRMMKELTSKLKKIEAKSHT